MYTDILSFMKPKLLKQKYYLSHETTLKDKLWRHKNAETVGWSHCKWASPWATIWSVFRLECPFRITCRGCKDFQNTDSQQYHSLTRVFPANTSAYDQFSCSLFDGVTEFTVNKYMICPKWSLWSDFRTVIWDLLLCALPHKKSAEIHT